MHKSNTWCIIEAAANNACLGVRNEEDVSYLYMASLATNMSSADWHKWRRSFKSSLSMSSFFCSFSPKSWINCPAQQGECKHHSTSWDLIIRACGRGTLPLLFMTRRATASFFCWKCCNLITSSDKRCLLAVKKNWIKTSTTNVHWISSDVCPLNLIRITADIVKISYRWNPNTTNVVEFCQNSLQSTCFTVWLTYIWVVYKLLM